MWKIISELDPRNGRTFGSPYLDNQSISNQAECGKLKKLGMIDLKITSKEFFWIYRFSTEVPTLGIIIINIK